MCVVVDEDSADTAMVLLGDTKGDGEGANGRNKIGSDNSVLPLSNDESSDGEVQTGDVITPESNQEDAVAEVPQAEVEDPV